MSCSVVQFSLYTYYVKLYETSWTYSICVSLCNKVGVCVCVSVSECVSERDREYVYVCLREREIDK